MRVTVAAPYHVNAGTGAVAAGDGVTSIMNPVARADWDACALLKRQSGLGFVCRSSHACAGSTRSEGTADGSPIVLAGQTGGGTRSLVANLAAANWAPRF